MDPENCASYQEIIAGIQKKELIVVDVRSPHEIEGSGKIECDRWLNIPIAEVKNAFSMDDDSFKSKYGIAKPKKEDSDLIFNCGSGKRSGMAINDVKSLGYTKARHYPGGYGKWKQEPL
ncbi:thiosulfate sulfurtransferase/rhodanese-like domain-containing protein 3 [Styela clava]|uniref:thiosulfate sulfurtransferase/rhodanese-like domain-containing protein 3 n=1 Tax=Styela clava TaxID=7725 RepID=UPI00193AD3C9|nr:thiosulfate sulfurtransferase/rhodanese-like domain-containing protein 3 [Styela clava]